MQFQYNSDLPGVQPDGSTVPTEARNPLEFPAAEPLPCARLTTRVYHPARKQVATVENVLVRTVVARQPSRRQRANSDSSSDIMSSSSSSSSDDNDDMEQDDNDEANGNLNQEVRAYWIQRTIREAIYGRVLFAIVLKRRTQTTSAANDNAEWEVTDQRCAVKEMSWQHIRRERDRLAEDPIKEVAAMEYIKRWHQMSKQARGQGGAGADTVSESFMAILDTNIMMPLDLLSDDRHLYSVMPFCDGGELFERLDMNERFSEAEARYWMKQLLNGLENMQNSGICHRDMSLENLLVHESGALIIDMGMCLRVPLSSEASPSATTTSELSQSMQNLTMNGGAMVPAAVAVPTTASSGTSSDIPLFARRQRRFVIRPQGTCGKWIYMSPEIYQNKEPFDGYAVDMWAAGVILFLMITGFPPWERACQTDERFKYMTAGYLVQMLTEWDLGLSSDAMDLLQRMLFIDPKDRLSLDQVRAHPWMVSGRSEAPTGF